ncbi:Calcium-independent phospholipase a2-gamma [Apiospora arundinis]
MALHFPSSFRKRVGIAKSRYTRDSSSLGLFGELPKHIIFEEPAQESQTLFQEDPTWFESPWTRRLALAVDGGAAWSFVSLIILDFLMQEIARIENTTEPVAYCSAYTKLIDIEEIFRITPPGSFLPCHYFDLIGGTSTGGLIATMLTRMKMTAPQCIVTFDGFQRVEKQPRFTNSLIRGITLAKRWQKQTTYWDISFSDPSLENSSFHGDSYCCQTIAFAIEDPQIPKRETFRSFDDAADEDDAPKPPATIGYVTRKLLAGLEPEYNAKHRRLSSDFSESGEALLDELQSLLPDICNNTLGIVLSLGCDPGKISNSKYPNVVNRHRSHTFLQRFNVDPPREGDPRRSTMEDTVSQIRESCQRNKSLLDQYAQFLVRWRRERANTTYWETFALGARYFCHRRNCTSADEPFETRESFLTHLQSQHDGQWSWTPSGVERELDRGRSLGVA